MMTTEAKYRINVLGDSGEEIGSFVFDGTPDSVAAKATAECLRQNVSFARLEVTPVINEYTTLR